MGGRGKKSLHVKVGGGEGRERGERPRKRKRGPIFNYSILKEKNISFVSAKGKRLEGKRFGMGGADYLRL